MDQERSRRLEELFEAALGVEPAGRAAFLAEKCAGDEALRREVESLLLFDGQDDPFLAAPAVAAFPDAARLEIGTQVLHYEIEQKLGEGGMGVVYKARDLRLDRQVALKFVRAPFVESFEREARAIASLSHPHIATLHDVGHHGDTPYLAMEYLEGLPVRGPLPWKQAIEYGIQIADALAAAHAAGVIHLDLKPSNILVTQKGTIKILDFGLAKLTERVGERVSREFSLPGVAAGSPGYMAPEQIEGNPTDARTDIFAFGCVLYELASGRHAFAGDSVSAVLAATAASEPKPLDGVPEKLEELIRRCLRKDPERRLHHIADARIMLEEIREAPEPVVQVKPKARAMIFTGLAGLLVGILLLAPATVAWLRDFRSVDMSPYRLRPFATALQGYSSPAWSPDGKSIAYVGTRGGDSQLYVHRLGSPTPVRWTKPPTAVVRFDGPVWSWDSREVYFGATHAGQRGLYKMAQGGEPSLVQPLASGWIGCSLSRDGGTLAFFRQALNPASFGVWVASPPNATPKPYEPAPFKEAAGNLNLPFIAFAPDGRKILVAVNPSSRGEETWLLPWPPGQPKRVFASLPSPLGTPYFDWMPDSRHVVFSHVTDPSSEGQLFMGDVETGDFWPVLVDTRIGPLPSVSPDGRQVVFTSDLANHDVVEVPLDGRPVRDLLSSMRSEWMPAFSPLKRTLVYVSNRSGPQAVWVEDPDDPSSARPVLTLPDLPFPTGRASGFASPVFSPDGAQVAVLGGGAAVGMKLYIVNVAAGSVPVRLTQEEDAVEWSPTWSPDGRWIAYRRSKGGKTTLAKARVGASEAPIDLLDDNGSVLPEWSPTGEWIAGGELNKPGITLVSPDGKDKRFFPGVLAPLAWSRDGKTIYQVRGSRNTEIVAVDAATGRARVIREVGDFRPSSPYSPGLRVTVAPDGKSLAWAVNRPRSELWILEGLRTPRPWFFRLLGVR